MPVMDGPIVRPIAAAPSRAPDGARLRDALLRALARGVTPDPRSVPFDEALGPLGALTAEHLAAHPHRDCACFPPLLRTFLGWTQEDIIGSELARRRIVAAFAEEADHPMMCALHDAFMTRFELSDDAEGLDLAIALLDLFGEERTTLRAAEIVTAAACLAERLGDEFDWLYPLMFRLSVIENGWDAATALAERIEDLERGLRAREDEFESLRRTLIHARRNPSDPDRSL